MSLFPLPVEIWGTVGQWASAIGTTAAFSATFYVIRRDAKVRRFAQARKMAFYVHHVEGGIYRGYYVKFRNMSDEPVYDVRFLMVRDGKRIDSLGSKDVLIPAEEFEISQQHSIMPGMVDVEFRDNSGKWWYKGLNGILSEKRGPWHLTEVPQTPAKPD